MSFQNASLTKAFRDKPAWNPFYRVILGFLIETCRNDNIAASRNDKIGHSPFTRLSQFSIQTTLNLNIKRCIFNRVMVNSEGRVDSDLSLRARF